MSLLVLPVTRIDALVRQEQVAQLSFQQLVWLAYNEACHLTGLVGQEIWHGSDGLDGTVPGAKSPDP